MKKQSPKRQATEVDKYVGERIRAGRHAAGISQSDLGKAAGVAFQQIQKYEKGSNRVSCGVLVLIANAINVDVVWFFEGCPGLKKVVAKGSTAVMVTDFFQEPGAAALAADFVRLDAKQRSAVRQLAGSL